MRLFYNERDIDEISDEINRKNHQLEKETRKKDKIEDEIRDKKKEQGKLARELTKVETRIKESVGEILMFSRWRSYEIKCIEWV